MSYPRINCPAFTTLLVDTISYPRINTTAYGLMLRINTTAFTHKHHRPTYYLYVPVIKDPVISFTLNVDNLKVNAQKVCRAIDCARAKISSINLFLFGSVLKTTGKTWQR